MTILGVVAVVFAGMTFMRWASTPDYAPLYSGLSPEDAGAVTQQLDAQGVDYKLTNGGGTIMVPRPDVYKARVDLGAKGLPSSGGDSFALLDKQGITTDQFTRNVNYQRALQGELARTIESIDSVQSASVNITIPRDTVFVGADQDKPTAAVLVKTSGTLPSSAVTAITNLVASSIPNMKADDVTVADADGKVLHAPGMDVTGGGSTQIEQKQAYEAQVAKKINDLIERAVGPGHAAVQVSADLDMSKSTTRDTRYTNPGPGTTPLPAKERTKTTNLTETGDDATRGPLGVPDDLTGGTLVTGQGNKTFTETETTRENAVNATVTDAVTPPGTVNRMSVSVVLDSAAIPAEQVATWEPQIANAAGIDTARDGANAVQVTSLPFTEEAKEATKPDTGGAAGSNALFDLVKHVLTLLMIGVVLFFAWRAIKRAEENRVPLRVPIDLRELEGPSAAPVEQAALAAALAAPAARRPLEPPPPTVEGEITDLIERQPEEVAQTLRSWLADRRG
jgi:flagellar M-ring protein FliF